METDPNQEPQNPKERLEAALQEVDAAREGKVPFWAKKSDPDKRKKIKRKLGLD